VISSLKFVARPGRPFVVMLWAVALLFIGIMVATWVASSRANPQFLNLEDGKPMTEKPTL
jgi:hypothetical protein